MKAPMQSASLPLLISPSDENAGRITAIVERGFEFHKAGDPSRAQRLYRLVLALDPAHFDGTHLLGVASRPNSPVDALRWITRALRLFPGHGPARHNLVAALQSAITLTNGLYEERRFQELCLVADTLTTVERFQEEPACDMLGRMLHNAAGSALYDDGDADLSLACADRACRLLQHPSALNFRMLARLNHQDYTAAWNRSDWKTIARQTGQWDGEPCRGPLVILSRNGTGDLLQFLRFVPRVIGMASQIIMVLRSEQIQLVRHSPLLAGVTLLSADPRLPDSAYCDVFSLAFALGLGEADIPVPTPYLVPPTELVTDWRRAVRRDGRLHVGITWASWATADHRSVPFDFFDRLMAQTDVVFVGLHSNFSKHDLREAAFPENFRFLGVSDLLTTACVLSAMDVVIAPDGGVAHLACALGVESWVLTARNCDWRWRVEGEHSPWYGNAHLFRQPAEGDWDRVWERVAERLADRASIGA